MVVVKATTFNLISFTLHTLKGITTDLSEKATNVYQCGMACESFAECGGFNFDYGKCTLVAPIASGGIPLEMNIFRMTTFRGRRYINLQTDGSFTYETNKQICESLGLMMFPPPVNSREMMTLSILRGLYIYIGGQVVSVNHFQDEFGNIFQPGDGVVNWLPNMPRVGYDVLILAFGYVWNNGAMGVAYPSELMCMET